MGFTELLFFGRGWTWKKKSVSIRWLIVQQTKKWLLSPKAAFIEKKVADEKYYSFVLKIWLGNVHVENEGRSQALPPDAHFVRVRLTMNIQRLRESQGFTQPARFQESLRFCEAAHGI